MFNALRSIGQRADTPKSPDAVADTAEWMAARLRHVKRRQTLLRAQQEQQLHEELLSKHQQQQQQEGDAGTVHASEQADEAIGQELARLLPVPLPVQQTALMCAEYARPLTALRVHTTAPRLGNLSSASAVDAAAADAELVLLSHALPSTILWGMAAQLWRSSAEAPCPTLRSLAATVQQQDLASLTASDAQRVAQIMLSPPQNKGASDSPLERVLAVVHAKRAQPSCDSARKRRRSDEKEVLSGAQGGGGAVHVTAPLCSTAARAQLASSRSRSRTPPLSQRSPSRSPPPPSLALPQQQQMAKAEPEGAFTTTTTNTTPSSFSFGVRVAGQASSGQHRSNVPLESGSSSLKKQAKSEEGLSQGSGGMRTGTAITKSLSAPVLPIPSPLPGEAARFGGSADSVERMVSSPPPPSTSANAATLRQTTLAAFTTHSSSSHNTIDPSSNNVNNSNSGGSHTFNAAPPPPPTGAALNDSFAAAQKRSSWYSPPPPPGTSKAPPYQYDLRGSAPGAPESVEDGSPASRAGASGFVTAGEQLVADMRQGRTMSSAYLSKRSPALGLRRTGFQPPFRDQPQPSSTSLQGATEQADGTRGPAQSSAANTGAGNNKNGRPHNNARTPAASDAHHNNNSNGDDDEGSYPASLLLPDGSVPAILQPLDPKLVTQVAMEILDSGAGAKQVGWDDIAGLQHAKASVEEAIVWPLRRPDLFVGLRDPPRGLLLFGPPGTGKTMIARAIANRAGCTFLNISSSSLMSKWMGDGEKLVRCLFAVATVRQPSVIFIDEIDSLLSMRGEGEMDSVRRVKTEFLVQLDGVATDRGDRVLLIGATNRPDELDEAARRRMEKRLYIPLPDDAARKELIQRLLRSLNPSGSTEVGGDGNAVGEPVLPVPAAAAAAVHTLTEADLDSLVRHTHGYSGADLKQLCREAAMGPLREMSVRQLSEVSVADLRPIQRRDFKQALKRLKPSVGPAEVQRYVEWNQLFGSFNDQESDADDDEGGEGKGSGFDSDNDDA